MDGGMKGCGGPMIALMRYPLYGDIVIKYRINIVNI